MADPHYTASRPDPTASPDRPESAEATTVAPPLAGRYELRDEIAHGGMGVVYRATDATLGREVAVKVLHERFGVDSAAGRRFVSEARITGQLQHPGIPAVHDLGTLPDGRPFLVMKLIKGRTLDGLVKGQGPAAADLVPVFEHVCQAVGYAHDRGVVHRDLKPANVMVGAFGEVQVMDWGLAKVLGAPSGRYETAVEESPTAAMTAIDSDRGDGDATRAGSVLGTPAYMPPEQAIGAVDQVDARSDVFGLGAILCAILTGKPPYVGTDTEATRQLAARGRLEDAFARLDGCGAEPELVALCKRCLATEKSDRPDDAGVVARVVAELRAAADERAQRADLDRAKAEAEAREQRKRRRVQLALGAAVGLLLAGVGAVGWHQDREATRRRVEDENRLRDERARLTRNAEAVAALLGQCEDALRADDAGKAALALGAAERRAAEGGAEELEDRLARRRADLGLLTALDAADGLRWTLVDGKPLPTVQVRGAIAAAFTSYGIIPGETSPADVAGKLAVAPVRKRALTALDYWVGLGGPKELSAILAAADPDPFRDAVRTALQTGDRDGMVRLAGQPEALDQPPRFAAVLGRIIAVPPDRRRQILLTALRQRPGNFGLLMTLGALTPVRQPAGADERETWHRAAVAVRPDNPVAWSNLGLALADRGDTDAALGCFREAVRLDPQYATAFNEVRHLLLVKTDLLGARAAAAEAARLEPHNATYQTYLGDVLVWTGDHAGGAAAHRSATRLAPKAAKPHASLAAALLLAGDTVAADASYREAARLDPQAAESTISMILQHYTRTGDPSTAEVVARWFVKVAPQHAKGLVVLAGLLRTKGDLRGAIDGYREAVRLDAKNTTYYVSLASALNAASEWDEAARVAREAVRLNPKDVWTHNELRHALFFKGDLAGSLTACRTMIELAPQNADFRMFLGDILSQQGDPDGAVAAYREAVRLNPKFAPAHERLAALGGEASLEQAITNYREAIRRDPKNGALQNSLGLALARKGDADGALAALREAARSQPKNASAAAFNEVRHLLLVKPDLAAARAAAAEAARLEPHNARYQTYLGDVLVWAGDRAGGLAAFREAIRLDPKFAQAHASLAVALLLSGDFAGAEKSYKEAVQLNPQIAETTITGNMQHYIRTGDPSTAEVIARWRVKMKPDDARRHAELGDVLVATNDLPAAINEYREALRQDPKLAAAQVGLGNVLAKKGDLNGAIVAYREAVRLDPKHASAHHNLGITLEEKGDLEGAVRNFEEAIRSDPKYARSYNELAWLLAAGPDHIRDGKRAVEHATRACELTGWKDAGVLDTLAAAYAEVGDFEKAVEYQKRTLALQAFEKEYGKGLRERLELYTRRQPYRHPEFAARKSDPPAKAKQP